MFINKLFIGRLTQYDKPHYMIAWNEGGKHMVFVLHVGLFDSLFAYFSICENKKWHRRWICKSGGVWRVFRKNRLRRTKKLFSKGREMVKNQGGS